MAIEMVGGIYCPLSPRDPQHRLRTLLEQTESRLVLVDFLTETKFTDDIISLDIDSLLINKYLTNDADIDQLSNIIVPPKKIAYIIFTSGSTGTPKAVCFEYFHIVSIRILIFLIDSSET
jgi:non-ribosomal peptide synthetase component F